MCPSGSPGAGRFAQLGREVSECRPVNASAEVALQALKASGIQSPDRFTTNTRISVFRLLTASGP